MRTGTVAKIKPPHYLTGRQIYSEQLPSIRSGFTDTGIAIDGHVSGFAVQ